MKSDTTYLEHISDAINLIESFLDGMDFESFKNNKMASAAVVRELEIIGEASNNLSEKFKRENPNMPLRDAIDMRNFLIHEYFGVDINVVWRTCKEDLPMLKEFIKEHLQ